MCIFGRETQCNRFSRISVAVGIIGITEYTPDGEPYIGQVPGVTGYYTACGFDGQGFCVGPKAGQIVGELIDGNESDVSLAPFKVDRLAIQAKG
ncbi:MAG: FAD-binding oxidoreductase [Anaerolineales bacterium]|nr:FAD-binding oxidoreductase [Anaerolineales bacterium]